MNRGTRSQAAKARTHDWKTPEHKEEERVYLRKKGVRQNALLTLEEMDSAIVASAHYASEGAPVESISRHTLICWRMALAGILGDAA